MSLLMSAPSHSLYADPAPSQRLPTVILGLCADQSSPSLLPGHGWGVLLPCVCQKGGMQGLGPLQKEGEGSGPWQGPGRSVGGALHVPTHPQDEDPADRALPRMTGGLCNKQLPGREHSTGLGHICCDQEGGDT